MTHTKFQATEPTSFDEEEFWIFFYEYDSNPEPPWVGAILVLHLYLWCFIPNFKHVNLAGLAKKMFICILFLNPRPLLQWHFGPHGHDMRRLSRCLLGKASSQISRPRPFGFRPDDFLSFHMSVCVKQVYTMAGPFLAPELLFEQFW